MSKDKHLEEKEKLDTEISRSLSVVKMKEAHRQIEDIEKLRKQASIKSVYQRISFCLEMSKALTNAILDTKKRFPNLELDWTTDTESTKKYLDTIMATYESICLDLQRTIDIKKEDFDRLFPRIEFNFSTYESIIPNLGCLSMRLIDMQNYCLRLL